MKTYVVVLYSIGWLRTIDTLSRASLTAIYTCVDQCTWIFATP